MLLLGILIILFTSPVVTEPFQQVFGTCIHWDALDLHTVGDANRLHCILDENNQLGIVKVRWKWIENGSCPYYDRSGKQIHVKPCDTMLGSCPDKNIISFQAINYSACITVNGKLPSLSDSSDVQGITSSQMLLDVNRNSNTLLGILAVCITTLIAVVGLFIPWIFLAIRRRSSTGDAHLDEELFRRFVVERNMEQNNHYEQWFQGKRCTNSM